MIHTWILSKYYRPSLLVYLVGTKIVKDMVLKIRLTPLSFLSCSEIWTNRFTHKGQDFKDDCIEFINIITVSLKGVFAKNENASKNIRWWSLLILLYIFFYMMHYKRRLVGRQVSLALDVSVMLLRSYSISRPTLLPFGPTTFPFYDTSELRQL